VGGGWRRWECCSQAQRTPWSRFQPSATGEGCGCPQWRLGRSAKGRTRALLQRSASLRKRPPARRATGSGRRAGGSTTPKRALPTEYPWCTPRPGGAECRPGSRAAGLRAQVLLSGFGIGAGTHYARNVEALVSGGHRVFTMDYMGQGKSWPMRDPAPGGAMDREGFQWGFGPAADDAIGGAALTYVSPRSSRARPAHRPLRGCAGRAARAEEKRFRMQSPKRWSRYSDGCSRARVAGSRARCGRNRFLLQLTICHCLSLMTRKRKCSA